MGREDMRAGDGDREVVADRLRIALNEGRLDLGEYDERLQKTYAAKTYGDLDGLLDDLPDTVGAEHSRVQAYQAPMPAAAPAARSWRRGNKWARVTPGLGIFLICSLVWLAAGADGKFWPVWTLFPLVFGLISLIDNDDDDDDDEDDHKDDSGDGDEGRRRNR